MPISVLITLAIVFLCCTGCVSNGAQAETNIHFDTAALTQELETVRVDAGVVGFAIGIIKNGAIVYTRGFGEKALGGGEPITEKSIFHWASVSKPFVATAIMQLAERDQLNLDAKLVDILPDYMVTEPKQADITIRQILLHISGLPDVDDYGWNAPEFDDHALQRWATTGSPRALLFDPGTERKYSNVGFEILGAVIEKVSGKSFEQYMAENIFTPLKMEDATFFYSEVPTALRTQGHVGEPSAKRAIAHYPYNRRHAPSSTLNVSIDAMAQFALALLSGGVLDGVRILDKETLADMWKPRWAINEDPVRAGAMGWSYEIRNGQRMLLHAGWDDGFRSVLILMPDDAQAIMFVTNDEQAKLKNFILPAFARLSGDIKNP